MTGLLASLGIRDRAGVEAFIERLIGMLDDFDPDPDLEPVLGWPDHGPDALDLASWADDREEENEHGGNVEDEPQWDYGFYGI